MITHGMPDSLYLMTARVISSAEAANEISGALQKVSLLDKMDSISLSVAMVLRGFPIMMPPATQVMNTDV